MPPATPPVAPPPPPPATPSDGYPTPDGGDWPDPDGGDGDTTDEDVANLEQEADDIDSGARSPAAVNHPHAGTIIGQPYEGTHSKAYNIAGGSDNWESENAIDIWLYPGTHVRAVEDGTVSPGGWGYGLSSGGGRFAGWRVHLVASNGRVFYYTHMAGLNVTKGQVVKRGAVLGFSGVANGVPHLHFAVNPPFDPHAWAAATYDLKARTNIGTSPTTGAPPPESAPYKPAGVNAQWRGMIGFLANDLPKVSGDAGAFGDRLLGIFK